MLVPNGGGLTIILEGIPLSLPACTNYFLFNLHCHSSVTYCETIVL